MGKDNLSLAIVVVEIMIESLGCLEDVISRLAQAPLVMDFKHESWSPDNSQYELLPR